MKIFSSKMNKTGSSFRFGITTALLTAAGAVQAVELPDGSYETANDGARGTLTIKDGHASLGIGSSMCSGGVEGNLTNHPNGTMSFTQTMDGTSCTVTLQDDDDGLAWISAGSGCGYFHGASCDFAGMVKGPAVPWSAGAVDQAFKRFDAQERKQIQAGLKENGHYQSSIDGISGPGTLSAISKAADLAMGNGEKPVLDTAAGATDFLSRYLSAGLKPIGEQAFFGKWNCEGSTYSFGPEGYQNHPNRDPLPYRSVEEFTPGNYGVTFTDGYRLGLMNVSDSTMTWSSPGSGDSFSCERLATAPAPPAPVEPKVAAPVEADNGPIPQTAPTAIFQKGWVCKSESGDIIHVDFRAEEAEIKELGLTTKYNEVEALNDDDSAFRVSFLDEDVIYLFEATTEAMFLVGGYGVYECAAQ
ncbi:peptidoglycan-binding protein (plasmid) [Sulfitobacter sp. W027]|uniref:peptidoglycan-binding domain-containing protein n=1 Tax=Sulfitobacter sp. W027 TaxID=2867025 RepID=UPI0021A49E7F|nr:peptidoglycan-binding domain-containing protein [Sulfitobacter sp. W027]UWR35319.1 peptidoglycan-binding protein [Sulfitobacter sp. W027]